MAELGYTCAFVLAVILARAGALKVFEPAETASGFAALDVPGAPIMAWVVPVLELGVAVALLSVPRLGGVAALVMLGAFSVVLARAIRAGVRAGCNCFGSTAGEPVSAVDLARNVVLAGLAATALLTDRPVAITIPSALAAAAACAAGVAVLRWQRARQAS